MKNKNLSLRLGVAAVLLCLAPSAWAQKVSALPNVTTLASNALFSVSTNTGGSYASRNISFGSVSNQLATAFSRIETNYFFAFDGDSRTASPGWPETAMTNNWFTNRTFGYVNLAAAGVGVATELANYNSTITSLKPTNGQTGFYFEACGINDLVGSSAETVFLARSNVWRRARLDGWKVVALTLPAANDGQSGVRYVNSAFDTQRKLLNALVRKTGLVDIVLDFDAAIRKPGDPEIYTDQVHWTDKARVALGSYAADAMASRARRSVSEPSPDKFVTLTNYVRLELENAVLHNGVTINPTGIPGADSSGAGVFGYYDALFVPTGSYRSFVDPIQTGPFTNAQVNLWIVAPSNTVSATCRISFSASAVNTNTLTALNGGGNPIVTSIFNLTNSFPHPTKASVNVYWNATDMPRQLWVQFQSVTGGAATTNDWYVYGAEMVYTNLIRVSDNDYP